MNKGALKIAKLNLQNIRIALFVPILTALAMLVELGIYMIIYASNQQVQDNSTFITNALWLTPLMAAIFIPSKNFRKIVNLGGKRDNFLFGSFITYVILSAATSLVNAVSYFTLETAIRNSGTFGGEYGLMGGVLNVIEPFGWTQNGVIVAFFQQFAFLFLVCCITHTLTAIQPKWYGWVTDVIIVAILATFIPIPVLRQVLLGFFYLIIFQSAFLQIICCFVLGLAIYLLNKPIFARKAI